MCKLASVQTSSAGGLPTAHPQTLLLQRKCACGQHTHAGDGCTKCKKKRMKLQGRASAPSPYQGEGSERGSYGEGRRAPHIVHEVLRSPGQPLDAETRAYMEPRFGQDFSQVRVHTDAKAAESARAVNALAYAVGQDIVFGATKHQPSTPTGLGLLVHELAHTVQQGGSHRPGAHLRVGRENSPEERQAEALTREMPYEQKIGKPKMVAPQLMRATRTFALTFDDGPHAAPLGKGSNRTEKVLDALKAKGITAGFFIQSGVSYRGANKVGRALVKRMNAEGHTVGIHTGGPKDHELHIDAQRAGRLEAELKAAKHYIKEQTGKIPTMVRPPTGKFNEEVAKIYTKVGLTNLLWDIDGDQGKNLSLGVLKERVESGIKKVHSARWKGSTPSAPRIVVLYHDIQKGTAENIGALIDHIKKVTKAVSGDKDTASFGPP